MFGKVTTDVVNKVYQSKDTDDDVIKMMEGVMIPDRDCKMIISSCSPGIAKLV